VFWVRGYGAIDTWFFRRGRGAGGSLRGPRKAVVGIDTAHGDGCGFHGLSFLGC
jgi:hypothetical protein